MYPKTLKTGIESALKFVFLANRINSLQLVNFLFQFFNGFFNSFLYPHFNFLKSQPFDDRHFVKILIFSDLLLKCLVNVGVNNPRVSAAIHLQLPFMILVDKKVQIVGQLLYFSE